MAARRRLTKSRERALAERQRLLQQTGFTDLTVLEDYYGARVDVAQPRHRCTGRRATGVRALLLARDYRDKCAAGASPWNYVMRDSHGREVDLHVIALDAEGNGFAGSAGNGGAYTARSLGGHGRIRGTAVGCIAAEDGRVPGAV